jgi:hypothetical protein
MSRKPYINQAFQHIYEGNIEPIIEFILKNPEIVNIKSKENHNKTILMCTLDALKEANYPIEQSNLIKLFYTIINQKNLDLKITDDYNNNIFDIIFKYARNTELNISKTLFTLGENLLTLIDNQETLKKVLDKKKSKAALVTKRKNFMHNIFPNTQEELLFEVEIEYLKKLQPRIINILSNIFQFKQQITQHFKDPIFNHNLIETPFILPNKGITLSWNSWLKIIENPEKIIDENHKKLINNCCFNKNDLIHNSIIESILNIYKVNYMHEKLLLAKLEDYMLINKNIINQAINNNPPDLLLVNLIEIIKKFKEYLTFLDQVAVYKLGNEYDKNKN